MIRFLYFLAIIILPLVFGPWLFIPMSLLLVYLAKLPYEIILIGFMFDSIYYFGDNFLYKYILTVFSVMLIILALFLHSKIHWRKII